MGAGAWTAISSLFGRAAAGGQSPARHLYFGDLHNHNAVGYAKGSLERSIDLAREQIEKAAGDKVRQTVVARAGVEPELAKRIQRVVKDSRLKVQAAIQGDSLRVSGAKRDDLQAVIALVRKAVTDFPLQYTNFRD